jgi:hypothetical protein
MAAEIIYLDTSYITPTFSQLDNFIMPPINLKVAADEFSLTNTPVTIQQGGQGQNWYSRGNTKFNLSFQFKTATQEDTDKANALMQYPYNLRKYDMLDTIPVGVAFAPIAEISGYRYGDVNSSNGDNYMSRLPSSRVGPNNNFLNNQYEILKGHLQSPNPTTDSFKLNSLAGTSDTQKISIYQPIFVMHYNISLVGLTACGAVYNFVGSEALPELNIRVTPPSGYGGGGIS